MITEDYCSFELSKLLKEKRFDEKYQAMYDKDGHFVSFNFKLLTKADKRLFVADAPTLQMAMKWLREVHSKNIILDMVSLDEDSYVLWTFNVYCNKNYKIMWGTKQPKYNTYEDAVEAAIKYCLINLIK